MATVSLTATFPAVHKFQNYRDIWYYVDNLNNLFNNSKTIRGEEVDSDHYGDYWGVFYVGRKPNKAVIDKLLADAGFEPSRPWQVGL